MREVRYETPESEMFDGKPSIFLAGPTVRGHQTHLQPSWRFEACKILREIGWSGNVIIPEFSDITQPDKGNEDWIVPWEYNGLKNCDVILFWIPRSKELIGLNTNFEFGYWLNSLKSIVYGRPDDSYRNKYLDIMYRMEYGKDEMIYNTLEDTCVAAREKYHWSFRDSI